MGKKIIALLLVGVLSVFFLIGCGGEVDVDEKLEELEEEELLEETE